MLVLVWGRSSASAKANFTHVLPYMWYFRSTRHACGNFVGQILYFKHMTVQRPINGPEYAVRHTLPFLYYLLLVKGSRYPTSGWSLKNKQCGHYDSAHIRQYACSLYYSRHQLSLHNCGIVNTYDDATIHLCSTLCYEDRLTSMTLSGSLCCVHIFFVCDNDQHCTNPQESQLQLS